MERRDSPNEREGERRGGTIARTEVPKLQVVGGGAVDITELIRQRTQLDQLITKYETMETPGVTEGEAQKERWRAQREMEIERMRRENQERGELMDMERRRLADMEAQLMDQRTRHNTWELEVKKHRLLVEEKSSAMASDFRFERKRAFEREADYLNMGLEVDAQLEQRRRELEDESRGVGRDVNHTKRKASNLLEDELRAHSLDVCFAFFFFFFAKNFNIFTPPQVQRAERVREQQQRDLLAWQREESRDVVCAWEGVFSLCKKGCCTIFCFFVLKLQSSWQVIETND